jgi:neutral amino acid transport system ATP-binding protein
MSILEVSNVSKSFGGVKANVDISMNVEKGKIVGLIGPNGSVKQHYLILLLELTQLITVQ